MSKGLCTCVDSPFAIVDRVKVYNSVCDACATETAAKGVTKEVDIEPKHRLGPITHDASAAFVDAIYREIHAGYGFTPLLGSGFSVSAGIPIIQQLLPYLRRCICIALGVERDQLAKRDTRQRWNPRTDRWPPLIDRRKADTDWIQMVQDSVNKLETDDPLWAVHQEALGAMAEWRSALFFLSRLVFDRPRRREVDARPNKNSVGIHGYRDRALIPRLAQPSQSVIDAGWREWMRDKRPSSNHKLLASLSGLMRIDVIMTTNFDDLTERAFEFSKNPLQVFDVHLLDGLPELSVVSRSRSIVKMHGSVRSLRADYSLDGIPSAEDRRLFAEYLAGQRLEDVTRPVHGDPEKPPTRKHLFVLGVGATEARTMAFLTESLRRLEDVKIFWVCFTERDVLNVLTYARTLTESDRRGLDGRPRIHVLRHTDAALLMLHIYQQVRKTLPPANAVYPATTQLSRPPLPPANPIWKRTWEEDKKKVAAIDEKREVHFQDFYDRLVKHIRGEWRPGETRPSGSPICLAASAAKVPGVTTVCERVFRELESNYVCMWIEMNDIYSVEELFETIQESAYFKLGQRDWTPLYAADDHRPRTLEITRIADASSKPFLVFINARETPGSNRDFKEEGPNGWLDKDEYWKELDQLLGEMEQASEGRFKVVLLARDASSALVSRPQRFVENIFQLYGTPSDNSTEIVRNVMDWVKKSPEFTKDRDATEQWAALRFLHTLVMMQRSRHLAITWSRCAWQLDRTCLPEPASKPNYIEELKRRLDETKDVYWSKELDENNVTWLSDLEKIGLLRRKDGGFIWMHSDHRRSLRKELVCATYDLTLPRLNCEARADIQQQLAFWYLKVFDSTGAPPAIFEAVDHLCSSAAHLIVGAVDKERDKVIENLRVAKRRVDTARQLLKEHEYVIFTQGYPRACSRRLDQISNFWDGAQWMGQALSGQDAERSILKLLGPMAKIDGKNPRLEDTPVRDLEIAIARLRCTTLEIKIMIAREIGENKNAYETMKHLHRQMEASPDAWKLGQTLEELEVEQGARLHTKECHLRVLRCLENNKEGSSPVYVWIQWWIRCGLLGIASRSFMEAERSLYRAICIAQNGKLEMIDLPKGKRIGSKKWEELLSELNFDFRPSSPPPLPSVRFRLDSELYIRYRPGINALQEAAYLLILWAGAKSRYESLLTSDPDPTRIPSTDETKRDRAKRLGEEAIADLKLAEKMALKGLILIEQILDSGVDREDHDRHLMSNKSRLLQLAGLASRYAPERKALSRHAMSMMGDAVAALNEADPLFANAEHAVIDLRRAEVRLSEADNIKIFNVYPFGNWTLDRLIGVGINVPVYQNGYHDGVLAREPKTQLEVAQELKELWRESGRDQRRGHEELSREDRQLTSEQIKLAEEVTNLAVKSFRQHEIDRIDFKSLKYPKQPEKECTTANKEWEERNTKNLCNAIAAVKYTQTDIERRESSLKTESASLSPYLRRDLAEVASRAYDAIRFLDRAEPILRERRRNVNWTTYYFELRLRAISLILWSSIVHEGTAIPYLGLEAAMRLTETEPDQLLRDAGRMIRVDSYRMARIVLAYASCARALEIRLALDRSAVRLPERLKQMRDYLDQAVRQLQEVDDRRTGRVPDEKAKVNDVVKDVVSEIQDRVRQVVASLTTSMKEQTEEESAIAMASEGAKQDCVKPAN